MLFGILIRILWTGKPGRLQSMGSQTVGHNWSNSACTHARKHWCKNTLTLFCPPWSRKLISHVKGTLSVPGGSKTSLQPQIQIFRAYINFVISLLIYYLVSNSISCQFFKNLLLLCLKGISGSCFSHFFGFHIYGTSVCMFFFFLLLICLVSI